MKKSHQKSLMGRMGLHLYVSTLLRFSATDDKHLVSYSIVDTPVTSFSTFTPLTTRADSTRRGKFQPREEMDTDVI